MMAGVVKGIGGKVHGVARIFELDKMRRIYLVVWCALFLVVPLVLLVLADVQEAQAGTQTPSSLSLFSAGMACLGFLIMVFVAFLLLHRIFFISATAATLSEIRGHEGVTKATGDAGIMLATISKVNRITEGAFVCYIFSTVYFLLMAFDPGFFQTTVLSQVFFTVAFFFNDINICVLSLVALRV